MTLQQDEKTVGLSADAPEQQPQEEFPQPKRRSWWWRIVVGLLMVLGLLVLTGVGLFVAQYWIQSRATAEGDSVKDPDVVIPTDQKSNEDKVPEPNRHPIEPALDLANAGLEHIRSKIKDYTAVLTVRQLMPSGQESEEAMFVKIRNRKVDEDGKIIVPFAVYLRFLKPRFKNGREVIWVEEANEGNLIAHEPGLLNFRRFHLPPDGPIAMMGQRYPIWEIGLEKLVEQLIMRGNEELQYGHEQCAVEFLKGTVDGHPCTIIQILHPQEKPAFTYYRAQVFIDDERQIPLRYVCQLWPEGEGKEPPVDEEYNYQDVKINVGLTDLDFDPDNPAYNYP